MLLPSSTGTAVSGCAYDVDTLGELAILVTAVTHIVLAITMVLRAH